MVTINRQFVQEHSEDGDGYVEGAGEEGLEQFIEKLERHAQAYGQGSLPRQRGADVEAELRKAVSGKAAYISREDIRSAVMQGLDELMSVQAAMDRRSRLERSALMSALDQGFYRLVSKVQGKQYEPETIEGLLEKELDVISRLNSTAVSSLGNVQSYRDELISYRDSRILPELEKGMSGYASARTDAEGTLDLFRQAERTLAKTKMGDAGFARLYRAYSALKRKLMSIDGNISMANQSTVFRSTELPIVEARIMEQERVANALGVVNKYVGDIAEHFEVVWGPYWRGGAGSIQLEALGTAIEGLSEHIVRGSGEMMAELDKALNAEDRATSTAVLDSVGKSLARYGSVAAAHGSRNRSHFDQKAAAVRSSYGLK